MTERWAVVRTEFAGSLERPNSFGRRYIVEDRSLKTTEFSRELKALEALYLYQQALNL